MKVVVTGRIPDVGMAILHELVADAGEVWAWTDDGPIPPADRARELADADAVVTLLHDRVDEAFLEEAPKLRLVANVAVGFNNIDVDACRARDIVVTNTPGVLTDATADLTLGLILMITRRLGEGERLIRSSTPWAWDMFMMLGAGIQGRRLGIVGMGGIGTAVAERARAFGMTVGYHNRRPVDPGTEDRLEAAWLPLDELIASSDVVSLHCPYSDDTHHLIDEQRLAKMQRSAFLINTARGPIVDESALARALRSGEIAGAALDVFEHEPEVEPELLGLDNVVLIPHLGSATVETRSAMAELAAENVRSFLTEGKPITPVG